MTAPIWMNELPKKKWAEYLKLKRPSFSITGKKEKNAFLKDLLGSAVLLLEKSHIGLALDRITLGLYFEKSTFLELIKSKGVLRHSSYLSVKNPVPGIAAFLIKYAELLRLSKQEIGYFESLVNSNVLYEELKRLNAIINLGVDQLANRSEVTIAQGKLPMSKFKALLAINEYNFLTNNTGNRELKNFALYEMHSKEEISVGISLLTERYNHRIGIDKYDLQIIDANYAQSKTAVNLIAASCLFINLKELELEQEVYGFQCVINGSKIHFKHPDELFAKSIEMSNLQYDLQAGANSLFNSVGNKKVPAFADLAIIFDEHLPELFDINELPFPRYVLKIPLPLFESAIGGLKIKYFREELNVIQSIARELMLDIAQWEKYMISTTLSYHDFLKLFRFFVFLAHLYTKKFTSLIADEDQILLIRSLIPSYRKKDLVGLLEKFAPHEVVISFLESIIWDAENENEPFCDLQYKSIIAFGDHYILPAILTGSSNLSRNIFVSEAKKGNNIKATQMHLHIPIAAILETAFEKRGFDTFKELPVRYKGLEQSESDIDFMAYADGLLVIAECKDSIHPTDVFEMRTTYANFQKAAKQMNYIKNALTDRTYIKTFCKKHGLIASDIKEIQTIIVSTSNKFWGSMFDGVPVRNVRELNAFMSQGVWTISDGNLKPFQYFLWDDPKVFKNSDLLKYCSNASAHSVKLNTFNDEVVNYGPKISKSTYSLTISDVHSAMQKEYTFVRKTYKQISNSAKNKLKKRV
jgi:hypothetical protein